MSIFILLCFGTTTSFLYSFIVNFLNFSLDLEFIKTYFLKCKTYKSFVRFRRDTQLLLERVRFSKVHFAILLDDRIRIINRNDVAVLLATSKRLFIERYFTLSRNRIVSQLFNIMTSFTIWVRFEGKTIILVVFSVWKLYRTIYDFDYKSL